MFKMINERNQSLDNNKSFHDYAYKLGKQSILLTVFVWLPFYAIVLAYYFGKLGTAKKKEETKSSTEPEKEQ